ncbi:MAG: tetratricopeptide repeat protein, partial [Candidatus Thermoplasmatota archaeon]
HASVIGQEFTFDVLVHTAEMPEEKVVECLDELIDAKLIYESFSKEKEIYKFTHTKIREVVYDSLSRPRKRYLHKKVGTVLEVLNAGKIADTIYTLVSTPDMWDKKMLELQKSNVIYALAHHFTQAMDLEKGTKYSIRAGDKASEIYALDEAIRYYKLALDSLGKLGESRDNKQLEIEVLLKLANCCDAKLLWDSALKYYEEAKKLCAEIGDGIKTAEVYRNIGHLLRRKGDVDRGIENIEKGLEISIEAGDNRGIADAYAGLGWISWKKGKYDKAIEYENMAIEYAEKTGDKTIIARICIDLGNVYGEIGDYDKGEEYYKKALDLLLGTTNFYEIARGYNNIGDIYLKKGEYEKGIEYFKKCLDISRKTENMRLVAYALSNIGECYARKNEVEEADEYLDEGLKIFKKIDEKQMISQIYMAYGIGYKGKKKWDKAKKYFDDSIKVLEEGKLDLPYTLCERYFEYALMYEECNDFKNFEFYLKKALDIAQQLGAKKLMEKAEEKLKKIHNSGIA